MEHGDSRDQGHGGSAPSGDGAATSDLEPADTLAATDGEGEATRRGRRAPRTRAGAVKVAGVDLIVAASTVRVVGTAGRSAGEKIDRFTVIEVLGEGGMGMVVSAHDPDLDRKVAIKLLRTEARVEATHSESALRLIREAQAMAKLAHPNVVAVHEVGTVGDEVYIAMEYVEGSTLQEWRQAPHSWREVVELMSRAGEGLAAAHAAGLVHRDFKPENVLVGADGRVLVSDFGIVGTSGSIIAPRNADPTDLDRPGSVLHAITLSSEDTLLGTLPYMSPEQFQQGQIDPRADQFAFCVALYETLYEQRPFEGERYGDLRRAVCGGALRDPPADTAVPAWVRAVIERGLSTDPKDRFPSMRELLEALSRDPTASRRRRLTAVALVAAIAVAAAVAVFAMVRGAGAPDSRCKDARAKLTSVWDAPTKASLEAAFLASERTYAREAFGRVVELVDGYADAWVAMRTETCESTHVRHQQTEQVLDLRMTCLDRRLSAVRALVRVLGEGTDDEVLRRAVEAAAKLPPIAGCGDLDALRSATKLPEDPELRARVERLRSRLDRASALLDAGKYADGTAVASAVVEEARGLGHAPTLALALYRLGQLQIRADTLNAGEESLREAIRMGSVGKYDRLVVDAWQELMWLIGNERARYADALGLRDTVEAAIARAGNLPETRARYLRTVGVIQHLQGEYREARETLERAVALVDEYETIKEPDAAQIVRSLGLTCAALGDLAAARRYHERAKRIFERNFGPRHPIVALALESLAALASTEGNRELARSLNQRVLEIRESFLGSEHREVAMALNNLGVQLAGLNRYDEARAVYERALAIWEKQLRPGHPDVANALVNLGEVAAAAGDHASAQSYFERALAVLENALGPDHVRTGMARFNLGNVLLEQDKCGEALAPMKGALDTFQKALGPEHPFVGYPMWGIGTCYVELGEPAKAVAQLERAIAVIGKGPGNDELLAVTRFSLARALWHRKRDRGRALELAKLAREAQAEHGESGEKELVEIDGWLRARQ